jgi:hypothetical protein
MGEYFPGRALPPAIEAANQLDLRFQQPVKPNELIKKWPSIAQYGVGLIVGPSGSGKVCLFTGPQLMSPSFFASFSPLPSRLSDFSRF